MKSIKKIFFVCAVLLLLMSQLQARAGEIEVFAAASLTDALNEIGAAYEKAGGDHVVFNFAASNTLDMQIKAGAPADIFFSADEAKMNDLEKAGLIAKETRQDLLSNSLVIIVPGDSPAILISAAQLASPVFKKIALGQPASVPAGIYAKAYLQKIGIWDQVSPHVIPSESVRAALAAVETGNVDAGIVYKTDALHSKKIKIAWEVPPAEGPAIAYPVALVQGSKNGAAAKKFLDYLRGPDALKIFEKYGFITKS
ncbi:MAG TPA: molybdate ABC transporter substrate-binding protein [Candidatus Methylacidiphilales bacterium]|nr:molybdate ABC transporter substrate-binding protein [Candidatus Methylacidiphilales bacterium]